MQSDFMTSLPMADLGIDKQPPRVRRGTSARSTTQYVGKMQYDTTVRLQFEQYEQDASLCTEALLAECMPQLSGLLPDEYLMQFDPTVPANLFSDGENSDNDDSSLLDVVGDSGSESLFHVSADGTVTLDLAQLSGGAEGAERAAINHLPALTGEQQAIEDAFSMENLFALGDEFKMAEPEGFPHLCLEDDIHPSVFEDGIAANDMSSLLEQFEEAAANLPEIETPAHETPKHESDAETTSEDQASSPTMPRNVDNDSEVMRLLTTNTPATVVLKRKAVPSKTASYNNLMQTKTVPKATSSSSINSTGPRFSDNVLKAAPKPSAPKGHTGKASTPPPEILQKIRSSNKRKSTIMLPTILPPRSEMRTRSAVQSLTNTSQRETRNMKSEQMIPSLHQRLSFKTTGVKDNTTSVSAPCSPKMAVRVPMPYSAPSSPVRSVAHASLLVKPDPDMTRNTDCKTDLKGIAQKVKIEVKPFQVNPGYFTLIVDHDYCLNSCPPTLPNTASKLSPPPENPVVATTGKDRIEEDGSVLKSLLLNKNLALQLKQQAAEQRSRQVRKVSVNLDVIDMEIDDQDLVTPPVLLCDSGKKDISLGDAHVIGGIAVGMPLPPLPPLDQLPKDHELRALEGSNASSDSNDSVRPINDMNVILNKMKHICDKRKQAASPSKEEVDEMNSLLNSVTNLSPQHKKRSHRDRSRYSRSHRPHKPVNDMEVILNNACSLPKKHSSSNSSSVSHREHHVPRLSADKVHRIHRKDNERKPHHIQPIKDERTKFNEMNHVLKQLSASYIKSEPQTSRGVDGSDNGNNVSKIPHLLGKRDHIPSPVNADLNSLTDRSCSPPVKFARIPKKRQEPALRKPEPAQSVVVSNTAQFDRLLVQTQDYITSTQRRLDRTPTSNHQFTQLKPRTENTVTIKHEQKLQKPAEDEKCTVLPQPEMIQALRQEIKRADSQSQLTKPVDSPKQEIKGANSPRQEVNRTDSPVQETKHNEPVRPITETVEAPAQIKDADTPTQIKCAESLSLDINKVDAPKQITECVDSSPQMKAADSSTQPKPSDTSKQEIKRVDSSSQVKERAESPKQDVECVSLSEEQAEHPSDLSKNESKEEPVTCKVEPQKSEIVDAVYKMKRIYRKRRSPSPKQDQKPLFDKLPTYCTNLSKSNKNDKSKSLGSSLSCAVPRHDRDPSPECDAGFNKLPSYLCFMNSTKYDQEETSYRQPNLDKRRTHLAGALEGVKLEGTPVHSATSSRSQTPTLYIASHTGSDSCHVSRQSSRSSSSCSSSCGSGSESSEREASRSPSPQRARSRGRSVRRHTYRRKRHSYSSSHSSSQSRSRSRSRSRLRYGSKRRSFYRSSSESRSRSRSGSRHDRKFRSTNGRSSYNCRSSSTARDQEDHEMKEKIRRQRIEERRIVYVGRIPDDFSRRDLRNQFDRFGEIEDVSVHFREHGGDNYGFVTFISTRDAYKAIERANKVAGMERYDMCFGGRREFCRTEYADLDGNMEMEEEMAPLQAKPAVSAASMDFDELLRQACTNIRKPKVGGKQRRADTGSNY